MVKRWKVRRPRTQEEQALLATGHPDVAALVLRDAVAPRAARRAPGRRTSSRGVRVDDRARSVRRRPRLPEAARVAPRRRWLRVPHAPVGSPRPRRRSGGGGSCRKAARRHPAAVLDPPSADVPASTGTRRAAHHRPTVPASLLRFPDPLPPRSGGTLRGRMTARLHMPVPPPTLPPVPTPTTAARSYPGTPPPLAAGHSVQCQTKASQTQCHAPGQARARPPDSRWALASPPGAVSCPT